MKTAGNKKCDKDLHKCSKSKIGLENCAHHIAIFLMLYSNHIKYCAIYKVMIKYIHDQR